METLTLEQMYYIGELVAAFVVLISLVYMAIQLRQNTNAIKLGTAHAVAEEIRACFLLLLQLRVFLTVLLLLLGNHLSLAVQ